MEHIDILNKIIEADKDAKALTDAATAKREHLTEDVDGEKEKLREKYMENARKRVADESAREHAESDRVITGLDEKHNRDLREIGQKLSASKEAYADKVFSMIMEDAE